MQLTDKFIIKAYASIFTLVESLKVYLSLTSMNTIISIC